MLRNDGGNANHYLRIKPQGTLSNRDGIGATVKLTGESGRVQYNHVTTAVGYASSSDPRVNFGLGADRAEREAKQSGFSAILERLERLRRSGKDV